MSYHITVNGIPLCQMGQAVKTASGDSVASCGHAQNLDAWRSIEILGAVNPDRDPKCFQIALGNCPAAKNPLVTTYPVDTDLLRRQIEMLTNQLRIMPKGEQAELTSGLIEYLDHRLDVIEGVIPNYKEVPS